MSQHPVIVIVGGQVPKMGILSTDHSQSSYGQPVVVLNGEPHGSMDLAAAQILATTEDAVELARKQFRADLISPTKVLDLLTDDQREALAEWARLATVHTVAAGGIGQTQEEQRAAADARWHLSLTIRVKHDILRHLAAVDAVEAIIDARERGDHGVADAGVDVLGDAYEAWPYLSAGDREWIDDTIEEMIEEISVA